MGYAVQREMEANMSKKDLDAAKRIFLEMMLPNHLQSLLNIPPFKTPLSVPDFFEAMYGGGAGEDPSSSNSDSSNVWSSDSSTKRDWSQILSEGHLCLDQIIAQLPPFRPTKLRSGSDIYVNSVTCAAHGLKYYNAKHEGDEYEFVAPLLCNSFNPVYGHVYHQHSNFLGRPNNPASSSPFSSPVQLFFVEWKTCDILEHDDPGIKCEIVPPKLPSSDVVPTYAPCRQIYHPSDVSCLHC